MAARAKAHYFEKLSNEISEAEYRYNNKIKNMRNITYSEYYDLLKPIMELVKEVDISDLPKLDNELYISAIAELMIEDPCEPPIELLCNVLSKYPFLINIVLVELNDEEIQELYDNILKHIDNKSPGGIIILNVIKNYRPESRSSISLNHYLTGFTFSEYSVGVLYTEFKFNPDKAIIHINASYQLDQLEAIVIYPFSQKVREKLLSVDKFQEPFIFPNVFPADEPITVEKPQLLKNGAYICIDYNTEPNYISVANEVLSEEEAKDFLCYRIRNGIPRYVYKQYMAEELMKQIYRDVSDDTYTPDNLRSLVTKMSSLCSIAYTKAVSSNNPPKKWIKYIMEDIIKNNLLPKPEIPWFNIYLGKMIKSELFDLPTAISTVQEYFHRDVLITAGQL